MRQERWLLSAIVAMSIAFSSCAAQTEATAETDGSAKADAAAKSETVARIGGETITLDEIDRQIAGQLMELRQKKYDLRRAAIEQKIAQKLVEKEAAERGVSVQDLVKTELTDKLVDPTKEEIDKFYEENKDRVPQFKEKTREQVGPQISEFLKRQKATELQQQFLDGLKAKAGVVIVLDHPRVELSIPAGEPSRGPEDAPVTIVEFSDYQCPFCRRAEEGLAKVLDEYGDKIRFVYRDFPLKFHDRALPASVAARCAGEQGKYWEYHDGLLKGTGNLGDDDLKKRAQDLELDMAAFNACLESDHHEKAAQAAFEAGSSLGVTGTPTFFINGRMLVGAKSYDDIKAMVDEELERAAQTGGSEEAAGSRS